jgi:hypothetical protein
MKIESLRVSKRMCANVVAGTGSREHASFFSFCLVFLVEADLSGAPIRYLPMATKSTVCTVVCFRMRVPFLLYSLPVRIVQSALTVEAEIVNVLYRNKMPLPLGSITSSQRLRRAGGGSICPSILSSPRRPRKNEENGTPTDRRPWRYLLAY